MSGEPLYMNIYKDMVSNIRSGKWTENAPLPAERALCLFYHVSRTTLRRALDRLEKDNYIVKKHGNGNFVKPQVFEQPLRQLYSFTDTLKNDGVIVDNVIVDYELSQAPDELLMGGYCEPSDQFHKLTRLRSAKDYPLMLEINYLSRSRFFKLDLKWLENNSLYKYLRQQYNMGIDHGFEIFRTIMPATKDRLLLNIPATQPCMAIERFGFEGDSLIEYGKSVVRGDKYTFRVELAYD